jgi:outer membrane protein OmpA-like peptidoglycan-associated protein
MNASTIARSSPFAGYDREFASLLQRLDSETGSTTGIGRGSREYITWVQRALNTAMGLRLAVDGILGPATRSAIGSFQQRNGLAVDGIVGPATEQRLRQMTGTAPQTGAAAATCPPKPVFVDCPNPGTPAAILDEFGFNSSVLNRPRHFPILNSVASQVVASQGTGRPCQTILIAGHTDPVGGDDFNFRLGWQRAETVMNELCSILNGLSPGITAGITFQLTSCGERQLKATDGASRRVEIFFPTSGGTPSDPGLQPCLDECDRQFERCQGTTPLVECARARRRCQRDCEGRPA